MVLLLPTGHSRVSWRALSRFPGAIHCSVSEQPDSVSDYRRRNNSLSNRKHVHTNSTLCMSYTGILCLMP
jgi:hypothetical protein